MRMTWTSLESSWFRLVSAMKDYSLAVKGMDVGAVSNSASAGKALVELSNTIPNCGGLVSFFTGDNSIADFGDQLVLFGNGLAAYPPLSRVST